jgi:hypothetical protein
MEWNGGMEWNGKWNGMEWNGRNGSEQVPVLKCIFVEM